PAPALLLQLEEVFAQGADAAERERRLDHQVVRPADRNVRGPAAGDLGDAPAHPASLVGADQDHVGSLDPVHSSSASFFSPGRNLARKSGFVSSSRWQFRQSGTRSFAEPPQPPIFLPTVWAGSEGPGMPQIAHRISRILSACGPK